MSFAEIFLRIGGGMGGWIIFLAHAVVIGALRQADCDPRSEELWSGTLFLAVLCGGGAVVLGFGLRWRESLKWFSVVAVPLACYALLGVLPALADTTFGGGALCSIAGATPAGIDLADYPATSLQRSWPVVQTVVLLAATAQALRYWREPAASGTPAE